MCAANVIWRCLRCTPSARRATNERLCRRPVLSISIHALREEGDSDLFLLVAEIWQFQSTPSARRATRKRISKNYSSCPFQSTPSARRATSDVTLLQSDVADFNPRPPRGGRPPFVGLGIGLIRNFNPRPPRGGRPKIPAFASLIMIFQSTPSARRATLPFFQMDYHTHFNPRPPRGGRRRRPDRKARGS